MHDAWAGDVLAVAASISLLSISSMFSFVMFEEIKEYFKK